MCKVDLKDTFRLIPVRKEGWALLGYKWTEEYFWFALVSGPPQSGSCTDRMGCYAYYRFTLRGRFIQYLDNYWCGTSVFPCLQTKQKGLGMSLSSLWYRFWCQKLFPTAHLFHTVNGAVVDMWSVWSIHFFSRGFKMGVRATYGEGLSKRDFQGVDLAFLVVSGGSNPPNPLPYRPHCIWYKQSSPSTPSHDSNAQIVFTSATHKLPCSRVSYSWSIFLGSSESSTDGRDTFIL